MEKTGITKHNIGLMGSLWPYRGGIAQHTTMLHRTLMEKTHLVTVSFKKQYPNWLYPGKSNFEPGCKGCCDPRIYYILDPMNPFSWKRAGHLFVRQFSKLVIIPWWTVFWAPCVAFIVRYLKKNGIEILFLCHNIMSHDNAYWKLKLTKYVLSLGDYFLVDNERNAEVLASLLPVPKISVYPVPSFQGFPLSKNLLARRGKLELLYFGFVRPYKGIDVLLKAMHLLKERDIYLTIAGEWWINDRPSKHFIENKKLTRKVEVINRYLTGEEVSEHFCRADVIILPYRNASGSGVIPLAYHYGKPVIATNVGGLPEFVQDGISGRLIPSEDPLALAAAIEEFFEQDSDYLKEGVIREAERLSCEGLVDCILRIV